MANEKNSHRGIVYISPEETALSIHRYNFDSRIRRLDRKKFSKMNVMEELLALQRHYKASGLL